MVGRARFMSLALGPPLGDNSPQNVAIGLKTDPVAFGTAAGAAVIRNSQRCRRFASGPIDSRSQLSKIGMPIETITNLWIRCGTPSTPDGMTSCAPSPPNLATSRRLEPTRAGGVQSRQAGFLGTPGSFGVAACPTARPDENHVARSNLGWISTGPGSLPITS